MNGNYFDELLYDFCEVTSEVCDKRRDKWPDFIKMYCGV